MLSILYIWLTLIGFENMENLTLKDFIATALIDVVSAMNEFEDFSNKNKRGKAGIKMLQLI